jgi:hypothetical protein
MKYGYLTGYCDGLASPSPLAASLIKKNTHRSASRKLNKKVVPGIEPGLPESESGVITITEHNLLMPEELQLYVCREKLTAKVLLACTR